MLTQGQMLSDSATNVVLYIQQSTFGTCELFCYNFFEKTNDRVSTTNVYVPDNTAHAKRRYFCDTVYNMYYEATYINRTT